MVSKQISMLKNDIQVFIAEDMKKKSEKISSMENLLNTLKDRKLLQDEDHQLLDFNFGGSMAKVIFSNQIKNAAT